MLSSIGKAFHSAAASEVNIIGQRKIVGKTEVTMHGSKLYVGNIGYNVDKTELETLFSEHGQVRDIRIIEGKGFGFVEMASSAEAEKAKEALDGSDFKGYTLKVDEARPPKKKQGGGPPRRGGPRRDFRRY
jgi:RNA recognition motif-containing protein